MKPRRKELERLHALAQMQFDAAQLTLRKAAEDRDTSLALIAGLEVPPAEGLTPVAAAMASMQYQLWADRRRAELNLTLARQTAQWLEAQGAARQAFGRKDALGRLQEKAGKR